MTAHTSRMPFGAEVLDDGSVRFRLWGPVAVRVDLCPGFGGQERLLEMKAGADGWFARVTGDAGPGSLYRYRIDGDQLVPDPASRFQPQDAHGPSQVVDPAVFCWEDDTWRGRPWEEAVFYELHVGTFSPEGTFRGVAERLDYLADLGITAIELMPVANFPGERNWGYDGVLPFAPDATYGRPADLKALVQAAHRKGLMVFLALDRLCAHYGIAAGHEDNQGREQRVPDGTRRTLL
jgi:maltooligosyltrehalose trehalohydrolase